MSLDLSEVVRDEIEAVIKSQPGVVGADLVDIVSLRCGCSPTTVKRERCVLLALGFLEPDKDKKHKLKYLKWVDDPKETEYDSPKIVVTQYFDKKIGPIRKPMDWSLNYLKESSS